MLILALETAADPGSIALWRDGEVIARSCPDARSNSETLLPLADATLREAGLSFADLTGIAFGMGPGSFTGLRVSCGAAQGLAVARDLPLLGIGTLEAMLDYLAKKRSDKRVAYVFPHGGLFASSENWYKTYKPAILAALKKWGVPYVDIEECAPPMGAHGVSELSDKYTIDGTHPNKAGYERFYMEPIAALLKRL